MTNEQYRILQEVDINTDGGLATLLNEWEMPHYTVCPACGVDDFTHAENCPEAMA